MTLTFRTLGSVRAERKELKHAIDALDAVLALYDDPTPLLERVTELRHKRKKEPCPDCGRGYYPQGMSKHRSTHKSSDGGTELLPFKPLRLRRRTKGDILLPAAVTIPSTLCPSCELQTITNPCEHCNAIITATRVGNQG